MKGIFAVKRTNGTSVCITYTPPDKARVRDLIEFVPEGREFSKRLREAHKRAEKVLVKRKAAIVDGKHELPRPKRTMTFARFLDAHYISELEERGLRSLKLEKQRLITGALGRFFASMLLTKIDEWQVRRFIKARRDGTIGPRAVGPAVINRDLQRLRDLWNAAGRRKLVSGRNPVSEVGLLHEPGRRVRYLAEEEEERLLAACKPYLRRIVEFGLHTGIRKSAILGLRWCDVDFASGSIWVPEDLSKSREPYFVPMNARVRAVLQEVQRGCANPSPDALVFAKRDGSRRRNIETGWANALERAGVANFRFHDLRHTTASRIVMGGGSLYDAGTLLGHRTRAMTERYAHLSPDHMRAVADLTLLRPKMAGEVLNLSNARRTGAEDG